MKISIILFPIIYINIKINLIFSSIYIIKFSSIIKRFSRIINSIISNIINSTIIKSNIFTSLNTSKKTKTKHTNKYR